MLSKVEKLLIHLKIIGIPLQAISGSCKDVSKIDAGANRLQSGVIGAAASGNFVREWHSSFVILQDCFHPASTRAFTEKRNKTTDPLWKLSRFASSDSSLESKREFWKLFSDLSGPCRVGTLSSYFDGHPIFLPNNHSYGLVQSTNVKNVYAGSSPFMLRSSLFHLLVANYFTDKDKCPEMMTYLCKQRLMWWKRMCSSPASIIMSNPTIKDADPVMSAGEIQFKMEDSELPVETLVAFKIPEKQKLNHCIEIVSPMEQGLFLLFHDAYQEINEASSKDSSAIVMKLHPRLAPFKAAITTTDPHCNQQKTLAQRLCRQLKLAGICCLHSCEDTLSKTIQLHDGLGTPYIITLNDLTVSRGVVAMRNRDNGVSEYLHLEEVKNILQKLVDSR